MPLARILTFDPGDAAELAQQLHEMGFQVHIANPNEQHSLAADLIIEFAVCDQQQALGRASAIAAQLQADVIVFPGAVPSLPKPIAEVTEAAAILSDLRSTQPSESSDMRHKEPEVILEQPLEQVHAIIEDRDFRPDSPIEETAPHGPSVFAQYSDKLRGGFGHLRVRIATGLARVKSATASGSNAIAGGARQFHQGIQQRMAEARAAWQQRQAERRERAAILRQERHREAELAAATREQERRREEEQRQALLPAVAAQPGLPVGGDFSLVGEEQEELRRIQAEKERLQAEVEHLRAQAAMQAAALEEAQQAREQFAEAAKEAPKTAPWRREKSSLRGALAGAVAAAFLFLTGMVLANFHSIIPVSRDLNTGSIGQESPFGPATVHGPPGVTVGGTPAAKPGQADNAPVIPEPPRAKPQPSSRANAPVGNRKSQWRHFQKQSENADNATADDVVVRHFPTRNPPTQTAQRQKVKRYSDE